MGEPKTKGATYLIVLRQAVVAQDLALMIAEYDPAAQVIVASSQELGAAALDSVQCLSHAFVAANPDKFAGSALAKAILARKGRSILLGSEAEAVGPTQDWDVLQQPFFSDAALALITKRQRALDA